ncbi:unnamed protein product [Parnassius mnemosyne]|uniref:Uncharacterized protein n=1 Tax=Parnassius mnemosyne TaxID=213953 RepID=A0AAV1L7X7_9NEOP
MDVIMCDEFDSTCHIPLAQEVFNQEIVMDNIEDITAINDSQTDSFPNNTENIFCYTPKVDTQTTECVQVTYTPQIETYKKRNDCRLDNSSNKSITRNIVVCPAQQDFNKIELLDTARNPTFTTPIKINVRETKLDDILVLPKTPQRKGVKQTKKTPYVITSKEY